MSSESAHPRPPQLEALPTGDSMPISPSLALLDDGTAAPQATALITFRVLRICGFAVLLGVAAAFIAQLLIALIALVTNLAFYQRFSIVDVSPAQHQLGLWVIVVPIIGALFVGLMARYGAKGIRGHGIPEAMEQVLTNKSRIPARITLLKPLSAAISIGTGGPFGAEGPIIATGGALGSFVGQLMPVTAAERKTLLAAGAAAGMTAIFGSPLAAVLLALELLLFEFRPRSLIPVALASVTAGSMRLLWFGQSPVFPVEFVREVTAPTMLAYTGIGAGIGVLAAGVTKLVYAIEDAFERLPVHWMWWPAIGAVAVGVIGYLAPRTLGVGYENIVDLISGRLALSTIVFLSGLKLLSWSISLGSGTSGGTLAPLLTIGGGAGGALGLMLDRFLPGLGIDPGLAALVGMAAMFAGAARAPLTSAVFALETTMQPLAILPLLSGCIASYLVSCRLMQNTIMTEKISRRGVRTPHEYVADVFEMTLVRDMATRTVVALRSEDTLAQVRSWLASGDPDASHQGYPVLDANRVLLGVLTQRDLRQATIPASTAISALLRRPVRYVYDDCTLRQATDHMLNHDIGRLPVVSREQPPKLVGLLTRSDILAAQRRQLEESHTEPPVIVLGRTLSSRA